MILEIDAQAMRRANFKFYQSENGVWLADRVPPEFTKSFMNRTEYAEKRRRMAARPIPELIELLASADLQTRFFAEMCLRDATST